MKKGESNNPIPLTGNQEQLMMAGNTTLLPEKGKHQISVRHQKHTH